MSIPLQFPTILVSEYLRPTLVVQKTLFLYFIIIISVPKSFLRWKLDGRKPRNWLKQERYMNVHIYIYRASFSLKLLTHRICWCAPHSVAPPSGKQTSRPWKLQFEIASQQPELLQQMAKSLASHYFIFMVLLIVFALGCCCCCCYYCCLALVTCLCCEFSFKFITLAGTPPQKITTWETESKSS